MVLAMPSINIERRPQADDLPTLWMMKRPLKLLRLHPGQHLQPLAVQGVEQSQRWLDLTLGAVWELGPVAFFVRFDGRLGFR